MRVVLGLLRIIAHITPFLLARERRSEVDDGLFGALIDAVASQRVEPVLALVGARPGHRERVPNDLEHQDT